VVKVQLGRLFLFPLGVVRRGGLGVLNMVNFEIYKDDMIYNIIYSPNWFKI
jgi:hypothetical protein